MAGKLILSRKGGMVNRSQKFKILIDGVEAGAIKVSDTEEFVLAEGSHTLQCKVSWMSSIIEAFEIKEGANTYLVVDNGMKYYTLFYILLLAGLVIPFIFSISNIPAPSYIRTLKLILVLPALIYILLYMTFLRKKYLVITADKSNPFS